MYKAVSHREHVLLRPDTYIGTLEHDESLGMSQGLYKIIDEIIVNAYDEFVRNKKASEIRIVTDGTSIRISNSSCIPKLEDAQLIFGTLLTSSNYDDSRDRFTGGRNGYGAKLTNIYSKVFKVTSCNAKKSTKYEITWRDNMTVMEPPVTSEFREEKTNWLHVEFVPDSSRLGTFSIDTLRQRMIEIGIWGPRVFFGDEDVSLSFQEYVGEFSAHHKQPNWEIYVRRSDEGSQKSFVNGVSTRKGGTHVDHVMALIAKALGVKPSQCRAHLDIFIKVSMNKPEFSTQTKDECTSKITDPVEFKPKFIKAVKALGIQDEVDTKKLKKSDGSKRCKIIGIPKLDDANWAGSSKSDQCTLVITEGDSAKALAVAGLSVVGRDRYGVFPLKGKPKNVRGATVTKLESNKEFSDLKKILGLKQGEEYTNTKKLRYGRLMIMTDADLDGSHIKGLVLNMFEYFWPSLLRIGFVVALVTPVIKADSEWFFTEDDFRAKGPFKRVKYYKGLGTSTSLEAKEYFKKIETLTVSFQFDTQTSDSMNLAFAKDRVEDRKRWIKAYMDLIDKPSIPYGRVSTLSITDFIHKDQIKFSEEDNKRSIPHILDGFKPSQRKVIFACLKKNLEKDSTVAQLSGYIGDVSAYHHGEASLHGTIIGLAQDFIGSSNNINLLVPSGQFGSRLEGGKDHASARYISTRLSPCTRTIFDERDSPLLTWLTDDGKTIEPEFFVPVIPMILVNGADGIGTGFSTFIPPCNPEDIIRNMIRILDKKPLVRMSPWYKGFTGQVAKKGTHTWVFRGTFKDGCVTELPPGIWIQDYKEFLDRLVESGKIDGYENHSTESNPYFRIYGGSEDILGLTRNIHTTNMFLVTPSGLKKFGTHEDILIEYMKYRLALYKKRKTYMLKKYLEKSTSLETRMRFIQCVISGTIEVFRKSKAVILESMRHHGFTDESLLNIKTYQYTLDEIERLEKEIEDTRTLYRTLEETTSVNLWKNDLLRVL
jgi:DNA topoisomerase-2